jgi:hypothetical protein
MRQLSGLVALALGLGLCGWAQNPPSSSDSKRKTTESHGAAQHKADPARDKADPARDKTMTAEPTATSGKYTMTAKLVDPELKAKKKEATVQVSVGGVKIVDPASAKEQPRAGQGHFHYRVDDGPVIATTATKLSFHELTPGTHRIHVMLAGNDHKPLGPEQTLEVTIPAGGPTS